MVEETGVCDAEVSSVEVSVVCVVGVLEVVLSREMEDGPETSGIWMVDVRFEDGLRGIRGRGFVVESMTMLVSMREWRERRLSAIVAWACEDANADVNTAGPGSSWSGWSDEGGRTLMAGSAEELI